MPVMARIIGQDLILVTLLPHKLTELGVQGTLVALAKASVTDKLTDSER